MTSEEWPEIRLGDVCEKIGSGATPRGGKEVYCDVGIALIRSQNVYNDGFRDEGLAFIDDVHAQELRHVSVEPGDVLLNITGDSTARACLAPPEVASARVNQHVAIVRPSMDVLDARFLRYTLVSPAMQAHLLALASAGATRPALTKRMIADLRIPAPSLAEQRHIADTLSALDDKIELHRRMNRTLESIARAIFKSWFVDFDPVRKKMEGKTGGELGLPPSLAALLPDSFEGSLIGPIPNGWRLKPLDQVASFLNGLALQKFPPTGSGDLPVIKGAELTRGVTEGSGRAGGDVPGAYVVHDGDVLFSWSGSLNCVLWSGGTGALNQHLFKVTSEDYPQWFCFQWIHQHLPTFREIAADKATTMGHIKRGHLSEALVVVPPPEVVAAADGLLARATARQLSASVEAARLAELRDALLSSLLDGTGPKGVVEIAGA